MNGSTTKPAQGMLRHCHRALLLMLALSLGVALTACHRKTPEELLKEAHDLYQSKDTYGAEQKYQKILDSNPDPQAAMEAHYGLAQCYVAENDFEHEREQLDILLKAGPSPNFINFLNMKVESYIKEKKPEKALETTLATSATLHNAPVEVRQQVQLNIAQLYQFLNQDEKSTQTCQRLIRDYPDNFPLHNAALTVMVQKYNYKGEFAKTIAIYQNYLNTHPKTPLKADILYDIAFGQKKLKQDAQANTNFDAAEKEIRSLLGTTIGNEEKSNLMLNLAKVQLGRENTPQGRQTLQKIIKDFPGTDAELQAQSTLVQMAMEGGNPQEAIEILKQIVKERPDTPYANQAAQAIQNIQARAMQTTGTMPRAAARATSGTVPVIQGKKPAAAGAAATPSAPAPSAAGKK